jgi:hypothetical protein
MADCAHFLLQALGYGVSGFQEFARGDRHGPYWPAELYRDESLQVFAAALGARRRGSKASLLSKPVVTATMQAKAPAVLTVRAGGDYFNLGGVFLTAGKRCVYVERQRGFADAPSLQPLMAAAREAVVELRGAAALERARKEKEAAAAALATATEMERVSA